MSGSRTNEILSAWRAAARAAVLPAEAPRPRRNVHQFSVASTAVALLILMVALVARGFDTPPRGSTGIGLASASATSSMAQLPAVTSTPTAPGSPNPAVRASASSSASAACLPSQLVLGKPTNSYGFSTVGTTSVYVMQPLRNDGPRCVLQLPGSIRVASANGAYKTVAVINAGTSTSVIVESGQSFSIVLGAWWRTSGAQSPSDVTASACHGAIDDVQRVELPMASGSIQIDLGTVWREVCSAPPSVSLTART